ncbi:MAG TPA: hypothetical protein DCR44_02265 [Acholeplasmatales bacterium]|nr:MAG: hypothetical protein A2Y16_03500 [Tenericutes bacterium GWF2_57_13]HAQ56216.1 hypothetical protein [Acholeplasmatales bacterium]
MLVRFRCKNFRSFKQDATLSMQAATGDEYRDLNTFEVNPKLFASGENVLLKSAVVYGPNASGKSNLLKAMHYMQNVVIFSSTASLGVVKSNEPFALCDQCADQPSEFEIIMITDDILYRFMFSIHRMRIVHEKLERRCERLTTVYERNESQISIAGLDQNTAKFIRIEDNSLFMSIFQQYQLPADIATDLSRVKKWFIKLLIVFEENVMSFTKYEQNGRFIDEAVRIMKLADIGIKTFMVQKEKIEFKQKNSFESLKDLQYMLTDPLQLDAEGGSIGKVDLKTVFDVRDGGGNVVGEKEVLLLRDRGFHSEGTRRLMFYLGWILTSLYDGRVILIDEIDTKFHFTLADYLLRMYNSIDQNAKNAQLVCTAHNLMLMDDNLRRDQIYFTNKDAYGASKLVSLSEFKNVRKTDLFSKKYLLGFYSSIPAMNEEM